MRFALDADAIETILRALQPYSYGWRHELPVSYRFFGQSIALSIETRSIPGDDPAPAPTQTELTLARLVLAGLPEVVSRAEQEYRAYNDEFPEFAEKTREPRLWICREFQETDGPDRWALTSGISDAPDWTIFVEFGD